MSSPVLGPVPFKVSNPHSSAGHRAVFPFILFLCAWCLPPTDQVSLIGEPPIHLDKSTEHCWREQMRLYDSDSAIHCLAGKYVVALGDSTVTEMVYDMVMLMAGLGANPVALNDFVRNATRWAASCSIAIGTDVSETGASEAFTWKWPLGGIVSGVCQHQSADLGATRQRSSNAAQAAVATHSNLPSHGRPAPTT